MTRLAFKNDLICVWLMAGSTDTYSNKFTNFVNPYNNTPFLN